MTLVEPGVVFTAAVTAPFESSVSVVPPVASVAPPRTIFLKVDRVPDDAGRKMRTICWSLPPTSFQLVTLPVQMAVAGWVVRFVTPVTALLTTMTQPWRATTWSTSWAASSGLSLESALTSESPICTAPWRTWVRPVPDPPPWTETVDPEQAATYFLATASTSGWRAVEPDAVMLPATHAGPPPADEPAGAPDDAAGAADDAAGAGVDPELHAPMARAAMAARVTTRLAGLINEVPPVLGRGTSES